MTQASALQQSVQTPLVRMAKDRAVDPNLILTRYAAERLPYRLSQSRHADRFVLKGAMLLVAWLRDMIRPTRDIDLLGFGDLTDAALAAAFSEIAAMDVEPDGVSFDLLRSSSPRFAKRTLTAVGASHSKATSARRQWRAGVPPARRLRD